MTIGYYGRLTENQSGGQEITGEVSEIYQKVDGLAATAETTTAHRVALAGCVALNSVPRFYFGALAMSTSCLECFSAILRAASRWCPDSRFPDWTQRA